MAGSSMRSVTGHVKINAIKVVISLGKAAFTEHTGKGIYRYFVSCSVFCIFRLGHHFSRERSEYFACTVVTFLKGRPEVTN